MDRRLEISYPWCTRDHTCRWCQDKKRYPRGKYSAANYYHTVVRVVTKWSSNDEAYLRWLTSHSRLMTKPPEIILRNTDW